jgi:single-strand DNA-binding protein
MASYNKVLLLGNLTRDPELRVTPKGTPVCQFGLAVNRQFKDESGQTREEVTFVDLEAWGKQAETIAKFLTKGRPLFVEGRLKLDQWDDKTSGQKRSKLKVVLENFQFLGGPREGGPGGPAGGSGDDAGVDQTAERHSPPARAPAAGKPAASAPPSDEDVPF